MDSGLVISVIIPTKDRPEACWETVSALRDQTLPPDRFEIVVVDDGSRPLPRLPDRGEDPQCTVVRLGGRERSAARNVGAEVARGELLLFLDDDITVGRDFVGDHVAAQREWSAALIVGAIKLPEGALRQPFGRFRQALERQGVPSQRGRTSTRNFCTASNMSIARCRFLSTGGFDEGLASGEDQDFALRYSEGGGTVVFLPEAVGIHRDEAMDIRSYCRRTKWGSERLAAFCRKHPAWPDNIARERVNGPVRFEREALGQSARKIAKKLMALRPVLEMLFQATAVVERLAPESSVLDRMYRVLLGVHIYRGYRDGVTRLEDREVAGAAKLDPKRG